MAEIYYGKNYIRQVLGRDVSIDEATVKQAVEEVTSEKIDGVINNAPEELNTLGEVAEAISSINGSIEEINTKIAGLENGGGSETFTETDPVFTASAASGITSSDITNWNSKQSTLTFDSAPTQNSTNPVTSGGVYTLITENELVTSEAINDLNDRVSDLEEAPAFTESDPVFVASPAYGITASDITNWNSLLSLLPSITAEDEGKILQVVNGVYTLVDISDIPNNVPESGTRDEGGEG